MTQMNLFSEASFIQVPPCSERIVNIACVPQRSPFRYPGGKTWLVPRIRQWISSLPTKPRKFVEPFAGGGIVGLTAAFEELASHVTMVELDQRVAAVWKTILTGDAVWLAERIRHFDLTRETVDAELSKKPETDEELAFQTILCNRINHGGILAPGSGVLNHGENGKGIRSRWYPDTLARRILNISSVKERIGFVQGDGLAILQNHASRKDAVFFIDPPYTAAGKKAGRRLYTHSELDHEALFALCEKLQGDFLMTYDNAEGVRQLADRHGFDTYAIAMKNTHHAKMTELLIGRNLNWIR